MNRRDFIKSASGVVLSAAMALTGTSKVMAATEAIATADERKKRRKALGMERRNLGGMNAAAIGLGCLPMVGYYGGRFEKTDMIRLIRHAYERGVTLFDTAEVYGPIPGTTSIAHLDDFTANADVRLPPDELDDFEREYSRIDLMGHRADPFTESQIDK